MLILVLLCRGNITRKILNMHKLQVALLLLLNSLSVFAFVYEDLVGKAVFPPVVHEKDGEPRGHLKPLGWQRSPEGPVKEYTEPLNANDFWKHHVKDHIPLVYRGYLKDSPAVIKWSDEYLAEKFGDLDVLVEHKEEDRTSSSGRMRLQDFLKNYKDQDLYVVSMFPTEMMHEVRAIPSILCGTFKNYTHESNFWMSSGGTRSVVHYDADHNLHCVISGRKDFIMINNNITTKTNLYFKKKNPSAGSGFSFLDPDIIDMQKFKKIALVPWTYASLYPGDCIFIPAAYIHQVRGYGRTVAVTSLFTPDVRNNFDGDGCTEDIMKSYHSMAEIDFQWTYKKGDPTIDMGYMNVQLVQNSIKEALEDRFPTNGKITKTQFIKIAGRFGPRGRNKTKISMIWNDVFGFSDDFLFDKNTIKSLSLEQWKAFCRAVESPHGVVTNGSEAVFVKPGEDWESELENTNEDEMYMTEREKELHRAALLDPMFKHLSEEEKKAYVEEKKAKKAKLGRGNEEHDYEEVDDNWLSELTWGIDEVPLKYRTHISRGIIPEEFKEEFMSSLSEEIKERFDRYFQKNRIPKELVRELIEYGYGDYSDGNNSEEEFNGGEDDENEDMDDDKLKLHYIFINANTEKQKQFIQGKVLREDIDKLSKLLPKELEKYRGEIEKGVLPKDILMRMINSSEEDFDSDLVELRNMLSSQRIEL